MIHSDHQALTFNQARVPPCAEHTDRCKSWRGFGVKLKPQTFKAILSGMSYPEEIKRLRLQERFLGPTRLMAVQLAPAICMPD